MPQSLDGRSRGLQAVPNDANWAPNNVGNETALSEKPMGVGTVTRTRTSVSIALPVTVDTPSDENATITLDGRSRPACKP